jgi:hypothetical protein
VLAALRNQFGGHAVKSAPAASLFGNGPMKKAVRAKAPAAAPKATRRRGGR